MTIEENSDEETYSSNNRKAVETIGPHRIIKELGLAKIIEAVGIGRLIDEMGLEQTIAGSDSINL